MGSFIWQSSCLLTSQIDNTNAKYKLFVITYFEQFLPWWIYEILWKAIGDVCLTLKRDYPFDGFKPGADPRMVQIGTGPPFDR